MPSDRRPLTIVFSMRHVGSFRMYESVVRALAARGDRIEILVDRGEHLGWMAGLEQLMVDYPTVTWSWSVTQRQRVWFEFSKLARMWLDYLRYFDPSYDTTPILRQRAGAYLPPALVRLTDTWPLSTDTGRAILRASLRAAERALPRVPEVTESLRQRNPDVLLLTPLVLLGSPQIELLRSAKALGLRTALCVGSWDHLSSKALIRHVPQRIFVWNPTQLTEATDLHGVPAEQVDVTGAQCYDQWFDRRPSRSREEFCAAVGLPSDRPFILWVCSALFWGSPREADFVMSWVESIRASHHDRLRDVGILIRPHPARTAEWEGHDLARFANVRLYGSNPVDPASKNDYFDSLFYSAAVVGLNSSSFLEAAILGRPVHTILLPEYYDNQEGTLHFRYLLTVGGGLLRAARDFETHHQSLVDTLEGRHGGNDAFVQAFVRPGGLDHSATNEFVAAVDRLAGAPTPVPERVPASAVALRVALLPVAMIARRMLGRRGDSADRTSREIQRERAKERQTAKRAESRQMAQEAEDRLNRQRTAERAAKHVARVAEQDQHRNDRQRAIEEHRAGKRQRQKQKERQKRAHLRRKRLWGLRQRIMERLGLT